MKTLLKQNKLVSFKFMYSFVTRVLFCGMLAYYLVEVSKAPFLTQLGYIVFFCAVSLVAEYLVSKPKRLLEVLLDGNDLSFLGTSINTYDINEILYSQTKRFEHTVRFRFKNQTYQDFELASPDLIEDLRFYNFLVENQLPVKMLDSSERVT
ncbi:hypothetical protein HC752_11980 [Vibrio sp. S9_S30]|nr:hypothetical protein [Vibrio sp. S9_S30]